MLSTKDIRLYLAELAPYLRASILLFISSIALGTYAAHTEPAVAEELMQSFAQFVETMEHLSPLALTFSIFLNNALKTFVFMLLGILLGIAPALFLFFNGFLIGAVTLLIYERIGGALLLATLIPHGIVELPAVLVGSAIGFLLGRRALQAMRNKDIALIPHIKRAVLFFVQVLAPLFVLAAILEVYITPAIAHMVERAL